MAESSDVAFRVQLVIPEQRELYDYWRARANGRQMPSRKDISPADFPRLLPYISLIDICPPDARFRVRLAGTGLRDIYEEDITGRFLDELDWGGKTGYWLATYRRVVQEGRPAQGVIRGPRREQDHLVQFWLRLPLSDERGRTSMMLCYDVFVPVTKVSAITGAAESSPLMLRA